jgi:hypothetical protein
MESQITERECRGQGGGLTGGVLNYQEWLLLSDSLAG